MMGRSVIVLTCIREVHGLNPDGGFHSLPQSLQPNSGEVPSLYQNHFNACPIHQPSYHQCYTVHNTKSTVTEKNNSNEPSDSVKVKEFLDYPVHIIHKSAVPGS